MSKTIKNNSIVHVKKYTDSELKLLEQIHELKKQLRKKEIVELEKNKWKHLFLGLTKGILNVYCNSSKFDLLVLKAFNNAGFLGDYPLDVIDHKVQKSIKKLAFNPDIFVSNKNIALEKVKDFHENYKKYFPKNAKGLSQQDFIQDDSDFIFLYIESSKIIKTIIHPDSDNDESLKIESIKSNSEYKKSLLEFMFSHHVHKVFFYQRIALKYFSKIQKNKNTLENFYEFTNEFLNKVHMLVLRTLKNKKRHYDAALILTYSLLNEGRYEKASKTLSNKITRIRKKEYFQPIISKNIRNLPSNTNYPQSKNEREWFDYLSAIQVGGRKMFPTVDFLKLSKFSKIKNTKSVSIDFKEYDLNFNIDTGISKNQEYLGGYNLLKDKLSIKQIINHLILK